jgi:hypothetical protein
MVNCDLTPTTAVPFGQFDTLLKAMPHSEFRFVVNDTIFPKSLTEAVALSPTVQGQLQVDACARRFGVCDLEIDSVDCSSLLDLLSGATVSRPKSHDKLLLLLSRQRCHAGVERLFLSLWGDSVGDIAVTFSTAFVTSSHFDLQSVLTLVLFSINALDGYTVE